MVTAALDGATYYDNDDDDNIKTWHSFSRVLVSQHLAGVKGKVILPSGTGLKLLCPVLPTPLALADWSVVRCMGRPWTDF